MSLISACEGRSVEKCAIGQLAHTADVRPTTAVERVQHFHAYNFSVGHCAFYVKSYGKKTTQQDLEPSGQTPET